MPALHNPRRAVPWLLLCLAAGPTLAAPPPSAPVSASVPVSVPDYGGRDSSPLAAADAAPNPAAQAGRALEALVVVLAGVVGVVYALKRFNLVKPGENGRPSRITGPTFGRSVSADGPQVSVVSSQTLPGGVMLHVVRVAEKNLLLAATPHTVTTVAEWPAAALPDTGEMAAEFEEYLTRADPASGIAAANARLRSLLSRAQPEEPS